MSCGCSGQYVDDVHLYIIRLLLVHTVWKKATVKMSKVTRESGFTLVEIMIVCHHRPLAAIAVPNFVKARTTSQTDACPIICGRLTEPLKVRWRITSSQPAHITYRK